MSMFIKFRIYFILTFMFALTACSDSNRERALQEQLKEIKISAASDQKKIVPTIYTLPKPVTFPPNSSGTGRIVRVSSSTNPLENYPLKSLRFTGTVSSGDKVSAYILTPDDMIYQVNVGDTLGNENGKVVKILPTTVDVSIKVAVPGKPPMDQIVSLQIKE